MQPYAATIGETVYLLFADSQRVGIRRYEDGGSTEVVQRLTPAVLELLERGCVLLTSILERYEAPEEATSVALDAEGDMFAVAVSTPRSSSVIAGDIAFMAHAELRQHQHNLGGHHRDGDLQEMISECGSALRAIQKSLYAIEPLLCELEMIPRFLPSHLATSLQVRRHYRKLWHFALVVGDVTPDTVRAALRGAGTRIAILTGSEVYSLLREDDRFYIKELQTRILGWLRDGEDAIAAVRIWQDFSLFVEILRQVNLREELIRHDREVLLAAAAALHSRGEEAIAEVSRDLRAVLGIDDALDEVILGDASAKSLLRELERAATQFGGVPAEAPSQALAL